MIYLALLLFLLGWLAFNWVAPFAVIHNAQPMSRGRISGELAQVALRLGARLYVKDLRAPGGFSTLAWPLSIIVFDRSFFRVASPEQVRFLIAHELGHCELGHLQWRWLATVTGAALIPAVKRMFADFELEADAYAANLTGLRRELFYGDPTERN